MLHAMKVAGGKQKRGGARGRDRLSSLPDCLLHDILSRLRSRQAVQTCALSRRWRHLWRAVPCIDIDGADFPVQERPHEVYPPCPHEGVEPAVIVVYDFDDVGEIIHRLGSQERENPEEEAAAQVKEAVAKMESFADNLLLHRGIAAASEPALDTLRLCVAGIHGFGRRGDTNLGSWMRRGLELSPAALDVSGGYASDPIKLPSLSSYFSSAGARRLKKLRLDGVLVGSDFEELLGSGGLPLLEELEIRNNAAQSEIERIACDTLRSLTLHLGLGSPASRLRHRVLVVAPLLASLQLELPLARLANFGFDIDDDAADEGEPCHLAEASIRLIPDDLDSGDDDDLCLDTSSLAIDLCDLLGSLFGVTSLHLSGFQEMVNMREREKERMRKNPFAARRKIDVRYCVWPRKSSVMLHAVLDEPCRSMLANVTSLVLDKCNLGINLGPLWDFLQETPVLERLALKSCKWQDYSYNYSEREHGQDLEATMVPNLKLVRIINGSANLFSKLKKNLSSTTIIKEEEDEVTKRKRWNKNMKNKKNRVDFSLSGRFN